MSLHLVAVDDHPDVVRAVVHPVQRLAGDVVLDKTAPTWSELRDALPTLPPPTVALVDLFMDDGSTVTDRVGGLVAAGVPVLVLTSELRTEAIREALRAGALGVVLKSDPPEVLHLALTVAARHEAYVSADLAYLLVTDPELAEQLSETELEVLLLHADGVTSADVGSRLSPPLPAAVVRSMVAKTMARYRWTGADVTAGERFDGELTA